MPATTTPADTAGRLRTTATRIPERVALRSRDRTITYGELDRQVDAGAGALQHLGVEPGDRVAIVVGNTPAFVQAHVATLRAGAAVVPLNPALTGDELAHALGDCGARVCVVAASTAASVLSLREELASLEHVVVTGTDAPPDGADAAWRALLTAGHEPTPADRDPDDVGVVAYTSGTTGRPKGAMLTRRNLATNQSQSLAGRLRITEDDTVLLVLPLFHVYALNVGLGACVRVGASMLLVEGFDPASSLAAIEEHGVTIILGAPPMYVAWLDTAAAAHADLSGVRLAVSGAAPLPVPVFERFRDELGIEIAEGYGLTEAGPSVTSNAMADRPRPGSVGLALPDLDVRLVTDDGRDVEPGDPGELWVRGPNVFAGYWDDPEGTAEVLTDDGWLMTGDIATRDEDGFVYLVDRKQDLIIVNGFNVYPREVERVLRDHPDVAECAVVGVAHPYTGEAVKAVVRPAAGAEPSEDGIVAFCRGSLARYKCPETVEIVSELPQTATGKVRRGELRGET